MNNKGFTLVELLTIIVLLVVLSLVTIPITQKVIKNAKLSTAEQSAEGFIDGIDKYVTGENFTNNLELTGYYTVTNGVLNGPDMDNVKIPIQGKKPTSGFLRFNGNTLVGGCLIVNGYEAKFRDGNFRSEGKGTCAASFATDSWADIKYNLSVDRNAYPIGSLKTVKMNLTGEEKDYTFRLINTSHPAACDNVNVAGNLNYSQSSCGVVIEFVTIIENRVMDTSNNEVGYSRTPLRAHLNTDADSIYNSLPEDLKDVIIDTSPLITGGKNQTLYTYGEKLFPLSSREINAVGYTTSEYGYNYTRPLDYYAKLGTTTNTAKNERVKYTQSGITSSAGEYWLRTSLYDNTGVYERVKSNGEVWNASYSSSIGVAPAFRIAE